MNPFAPYVIQDIMKPNENKWLLHEELFKKNENQEVNPAFLEKNSAQMFGVYKYFENPDLKVKSEHYLEDAEYT